MTTIEWINNESDIDSMIDLPPNSHTRNRGFETHIIDLWYQSYEQHPKNFSQKGIFHPTIKNLWEK